MKISRISQTTVLVYFASLFSAVAFGNQIEVNYSLPVERSLTPFSTFQIESASWFEEGDLRKIRYALPSDLVGSEKIELDMFGNVNPNEVFFQMVCDRGRGMASCIAGKDSVSCAITFKNLSYSLEAVHKYLEAKYSGDPNLENRKKVASKFAGVSIDENPSSSFSNEPIGSLTIFRNK